MVQKHIHTYTFEVRWDNDLQEGGEKKEFSAEHGTFITEKAFEEILKFLKKGLEEAQSNETGLLVQLWVFCSTNDHETRSVRASLTLELVNSNDPRLPISIVSEMFESLKLGPIFMKTNGPVRLRKDDLEHIWFSRS